MDEEKLFTPKQAAERLGFTVQTLANWRHKRRGPKYLKIGQRAIRYRGGDLNEFEKSSVIEING